MGTNDSIIGPVNVGNPIDYSILDIAKVIISKTDSKSKIVFLNKTVDDPMQRKPDISLAMNLLKGWSPKIEFNQGLERTISYFQEYLRRTKV